MGHLMSSSIRVAPSCRRRDMLARSTTLERVGSLERRTCLRQRYRKMAVRISCTRLMDSGQTVLLSEKGANPKRRFVNPIAIQI